MFEYLSCIRKRKYDSEKHARRIAKKRMAAGAPQLYPYYCNICGSFHLTKKAKYE